MSALVKEGRSLAPRARMAAIAATVAVLLLALCASAAQASVTRSPGGPFNDPDTVTVSGSVPGAFSTATHFTVAQCNNTVTLGTRCNQANSVPFTSVASYAGGVPLTIDKTFADFDFTTNSTPNPPTSTTCKDVFAVGDQCAIVVSYYRFVMGVPTHVGTDPDSGTSGTWVTFL